MCKLVCCVLCCDDMLLTCDARGRLRRWDLSEGRLAGATATQGLTVTSAVYSEKEPRLANKKVVTLTTDSGLSMWELYRHKRRAGQRIIQLDEQGNLTMQSVSAFIDSLQ